MKYITAKQALMPNGWQCDIQIGIGADGQIGYVGPEKTKDAQVLALVMPAPSNLHSHTFQRAMAGLTEARGPDGKDSFWTWRKLMYAFLESLNPDHIEAITAFAFMEMLEAGYAGVGEFHYLHHAQQGKPYANLSELGERIITAAQSTGIGLTLLPVLYQYGGLDKRPLQGGQLRFGNNIDQFSNLYENLRKTVIQSHSDFTLGVAPHSLRAVDGDGLNATIEICPQGPVHMHVAEQIIEVKEVEAALLARPVDWLLDNYSIDSRWCLIHCTQMSEQETRKLAKSSAVAGLCPITESNLGDGIFNGADYLEAGGRIGIGSDSNVHISFFEELKTLEYSQRLKNHGRAVLARQQHSSGRVLFEEAVKGGAQAIKRNSGVISQGMLADLVGIEIDNQWICNRQGDTCLDSLIFSGYGQNCITDVWSAGRHVVTNGRHHLHSTIVDNFRKTISELESSI